MSIKRLVVILGMVFLVTSCTTDKYGDTYLYGFRKPSTTTEMGVQYLLGRGVQKDYKRAFYYFNQAAEQGDPLAQNELGYMYAVGKGTPRDDEKAFLYYHQAANHGLASAQYNLGLLYLHGRGTPVNKAKALECFKLSADAGFEPAKVALKRYAS
jgi:TPR repeat protein